MGFFDAPELTASAAGLGVTHPPGHPLWVALGALSTLLPLGDLPFRIALTSGLCLGLISRMAYSVSLRLSTTALSDSPQPIRVWASPLALGAALLSTVGIAPLAQTSRVEVYALASALGLALFTVSRCPSLSPAARARTAVFVLALGGTNHHFIALTTAPAALWAMSDKLRRSSLNDTLRHSILPWATLGLIGLLPYVLLPLRANAPASLVRVTTLGDLWWTISARAFQKNIGTGVPGTLGENLLDCLDWIGRSLTPLGLLASLAGLWFCLRLPQKSPARTDGIILSLLFLTSLLARASLGFVSHNPDAAGYLLPSIFSLGILTTVFTSRALTAITTSPPAPAGPTRSARALLTLCLVVSPSLAFIPAAYSSFRATSPDRGSAPETITASTLSTVPLRATVLAYSPETVFRLRYSSLIEGDRPDLTLVMVPFLSWPGATDALLSRAPYLLALVRDQLSHGSPRSDTLTELSHAKPLRIELDPHNLLAMVPYVLPQGALAEFRAEPTTLAAVRATAAAHFSSRDALVASLREHPRDFTAPKTQEYLLWRNYNDAVFFAARGARPESRASLRRALDVSPRAHELLGLREALDSPGEGPIDVRLWLVGGGSNRPNSQQSHSVSE